MVQKASRTGHFERFFGYAWNESENLAEENFKMRLDRALETQDTDTSRLLLAALAASASLLVLPTAESSSRLPRITSFRLALAWETMSAPPAAAAAPPAAAPAPAATTLFDDPLDYPELYPTFDELLKALQDMGTKVTTGKSAGEMRYNSLTKVVSKTQKTLISKYKHYGIPKNATDTRDKSRVTVFGFEKNKMW